MLDATLRTWALGALQLHLPLHPRGPGLDYVGVLVAAATSWAGLPGPGEVALIAAAISAAHEHLDLTSLIAVAWLGATAGGMAGWFVGLKAGRGVATAPGPLRQHRRALVAKGDRFYARYGAVAVLLTPSWIAGIHNMPLSRYAPINAASALAWSLAIGLGAYAAGPSIVDVANDVGLAGSLALAVVVAIAAIIAWRRRRAGPT